MSPLTVLPRVEPADDWCSLRPRTGDGEAVTDAITDPAANVGDRCRANLGGGARGGARDLKSLQRNNCHGWEINTL